jgi:hypothetical protein
MQITLPDVGSPAWGTPLNTALTALNTGKADKVSINPMQDYSAKGDGVTDDTAAIQSAINALGSQGGEVFLPPGNFLLNGSSPLNLTAPITLRGSGHGATTIRIGAGFTGTSAITVSSDDCMIQGLQIRGASSTTTSNPACHGVTATGVQELRVFNTTFQYVNGYALRTFGTSGTTLHGTQINMIKIQSCAGGIHVKSDPAALAANVQISNVFTRFLGVNSGPNANLDGFRIEDSWDVLAQNIMPWMQATNGGTGAALRVSGNCAAIFIQNLDALGPQTGSANVVVESGANGDPQNVQIQGGVIQQGLVGILISGASNQVRVRNVRILNNQTHNVSVTSTGYGIYFDECLISQGGAGATGTNYDVSWTGTAEGFITDTRFGSAVVASGTAGVQGIINIANGTIVRVVNANFTGTGTTSANWYPTASPQFATRVDGSNVEFSGNIDFRLNTARLSLRPNASSNNVLATNVNGADANDRFRLLGDGTQQIGPGTAGRDTTTGRAATGVWYTDKNALIGSATALGDNGVGEIQLADAATVPTTNPAAGSVIYSASASAVPVKMRDVSGNVRGLVPAYAIASADQTVSVITQTASTYLAVPIEASATYLMEGFLTIQTPNAVNFVHSFTGPSGAAMVWGDSTATSVATLTGTDTWSGNGVNKTAMIKGMLTTSTTAGTLTVTFASGTAANNAILRSGSWVRLTRVK